MNPMIEHLQTLMVRDLKAFAKEIEAFPDDAKPWSLLPGTANSAANLALHVAGNLQFFIGAMLGNSGYVRDRAAEFSQRSGTREEVVQALGRALEAVETVLPRLTEEELLQELPFTLEGRRFPVNVVLLRLEAHLAYHLGQANYLRRVTQA